MCHGADDYTLYGTRWNKTLLTWYAEKPIRVPLYNALKLWSKYGNFVFEEALSCQKADICASFKSKNHENCTPFDGPGGVLGHAFGPGTINPLSGDIHLDEEEHWPLHTLFTVLLHEVGHALGIGHTHVSDAIMFPLYKPLKSMTLHEDDIFAIQNIFPATSSNTVYILQPWIVLVSLLSTFFTNYFKIILFL